MTTLSVMQPYFLPYLGYWQLMKAADRHVVYDDVNYIKGGWINRNRLQVAGRPTYFTVPLAHASSFRRICEIDTVRHSPWRTRLLRMFELAYRRAPGFPEVFPAIERILQHEAANLAEFLLHQLRTVAGLLGITTELVHSSRHYGNHHLSGQARVLDICRREGATTYVNLPGGRALYDAGAFQQAGISLRFLQMRLPNLPAPGAPESSPYLSIVDTLMQAGPQRTRELLNACDLTMP